MQARFYCLNSVKTHIALFLRKRKDNRQGSNPKRYRKRGYMLRTPLASVSGAQIYIAALLRKATMRLGFRKRDAVCFSVFIS